MLCPVEENVVNCIGIIRDVGAVEKVLLGTRLLCIEHQIIETRDSHLFTTTETGGRKGVPSSIIPIDRSGTAAIVLSWHDCYDKLLTSCESE